MGTRQPRRGGRRRGPLRAVIAGHCLVSEFTDVQPAFCWSGTELSPGIFAWFFIPSSGFQLFDVESSLFSAVAVRPGDVAASVPEPQTLALALLALGATLVARRRRSKLRL